MLPKSHVVVKKKSNCLPEQQIHPSRKTSCQNTMVQDRKSVSVQHHKIEESMIFLEAAQNIHHVEANGEEMHFSLNISQLSTFFKRWNNVMDQLQRFRPLFEFLRKKLEQSIKQIDRLAQSIKKNDIRLKYFQKQNFQLQNKLKGAQLIQEIQHINYLHEQNRHQQINLKSQTNQSQSRKSLQKQSIQNDQIGKSKHSNHLQFLITELQRRKFKIIDMQKSQKKKSLQKKKLQEQLQQEKNECQLHKASNKTREIMYDFIIKKDISQIIKHEYQSKSQQPMSQQQTSVKMQESSKR